MKVSQLLWEYWTHWTAGTNVGYYLREVNIKFFVRVAYSVLSSRECRRPYGMWHWNSL